jgi:hypothetical protein
MNLRLEKVRLIARRVKVPLAAVLVVRFDDLTWEPNREPDLRTVIVNGIAGSSPAAAVSI